MAEEYDFIVVGAGASGAVLASRLAHTPAAPSVLLLEAGDSNSGAARHSGADRFDTAFSDGSPLNWHYRTVPQTYLAGQEIDYSRGRGLGGSTAINFCAWTVGPKDDYDEWARIVGDERFVWSNVKRVLKRISNLNHQIPDQKLRHVVYPKPHHHSTEGNVKLTYGDEWLPDVGDIFTAARQAGHRINSDVNDGDAIGMGMGSVCIAKGIRATSASAYLSQPPQNLVIVVNAQIARVLFIKRQAIGVERIDGQQFIARNQVILSAGALNTPQILKCSGIGPANELEKYGIPLIYELPAVGENLQDHCFSTMGIVLEKDTTLPIGPLKQTPTPMGWLKLPSITSSPEFQSLSPQTQEHILRPTVPVIEIAAPTPPSFSAYQPAESESYFGAVCMTMNPQSKGTVTLQSPDPSKPPRIDPKFLTHPFDRRVLIDGIREVMRILRTPVFVTRTLKTLGPVDDSDEAIWEHVKSNLSSSWHMSCTAAMGTDEKEAVVDSQFKVFGVDGLSIVDLSVCPFVINAHTQSTAYVLGEMGAEVLADEFKLGAVSISGKPGLANR